jgi:Protein of unknown function (DUF3987)
MAKTLTPDAVDDAPDVTLADVVDAPEPLRRALPPPEPYPLDALGTILAPMARKLREVVQAPDAICGQSVLGAGTLAVQGHADVTNDGRSHPLSDYLLTVGESGERKSAVDRCALWPHRHWERSLHERYRGEALAYQNEVEAYRKARDEALKQAKGRAAKKVALDMLGPPPTAPLEAMLIVEEPTYEGLIKALRIGQPSMGLFADEGGRLIGGHGMNQDNQLKTAAGLSELWDGIRISRVRATDETTILYGRRLSMHVMVQPVVAHSVLSNTLLLGQGFLSRCLIAWPTSTAGTRLYKAINLAQDPEVKRYNARLLTILETSFPLAADTQNELTPRALALSASAKRFWVAFHDHVERQLGDEGSLAPVRGFANKAAEHATRLAGVLTLVDDLAAAEINAAHMQAGIALAQFYLIEALRLVDAGATDQDLLLAEKLLAWAQEHEHIYLRQIYQFGPNSIRDAKTAKRLVSILEEHGWLIRVEGGMELDGAHRREVWRVWRHA